VNAQQIETLPNELLWQLITRLYVTPGSNQVSAGLLTAHLEDYCRRHAIPVTWKRQTVHSWFSRADGPPADRMHFIRLWLLELIQTATATEGAGGGEAQKSI